MNVAIRADASHRIGAGHVMRCLTLADELREDKSNTIFFCRDHEGHLKERINARGYECYMLETKPSNTGNAFITSDHPKHAAWLGASWQEDVKQVKEKIRKNGLSIDWFVIDHYGIDARWESEIRKNCGKVMVIDDLADRKHECDVLLDQTLGRVKESYQNLVPENCCILSGSHYALVRSEFAELRSQLLAKPKQRDRIRKILVTLGWMDSVNMTIKVIDALESISWAHIPCVDIVLSKSAPHYKKVLQRLDDSSLGFRLLSDVDNMADLIYEADLAIGAAGATSWERCCLGLPTVMIVTAENQKLIAKNLAASGAALYAGVWSNITQDDIEGSCQKLLDNGDLYHAMVESAMGICDGLGAKRIKEILAYNG